MDPVELADIAARAAGENFPVGSVLFPRPLRPHIRALYCYARLVDELGDAYEGDRLAALDELEREVDATFAGAADVAGAAERAADDPRVRPAARAVPAADRGESNGPARRRVRDLGGRQALLRPLGRSRAAVSCSASSAARRAGDRRGERLRLHRAPARELPPGRAADLELGRDLPARGGSPHVRRSAARPAERGAARAAPVRGRRARGAARGGRGAA